MYRAISDDSYVREDNILSVTELISSPRCVQLARRHDDEIEVDVIDMVRMFSGNCFHKAMEQSNLAYPLALVESRMYVTINGQKISGTADLFKDCILADYKETSVWKYTNGDFTDWEAQLNCYAYLLNAHEHSVSKAVIRVKFYDWKKNDKLRYGSSYPAIPILEIPIPLWCSYKQEKCLEERIRVHTSNMDLDDAHLDYCTSKEMWEKPTVYAVYKGDNKKATKLFEDKNKAAEHVRMLNAKRGKVIYNTKVRPGKRTKCIDYCNVSRFCNQYKDYMDKEGA